MDVISWLRRGSIGRVRELLAEVDAYRKANTAMQIRLAETTEKLERAYSQVSDFEDQALGAEEKAALTKARVDDLLREIEYLKEQVKIYQTRLGLLPQERQATNESNLEPLRKPREPFAVVQARVQVQRTEEYWRRKAEQVEPTGVTGTTTDTPTVSEKES